MQSDTRGLAALLLVTAVWGTTFPAMKLLSGHLDALQIIWLRFAIALLVLAPLWPGMRTSERRWGLLLGALFGCAAPAADKGGEASSAFAFAAAQQAPDAAAVRRQLQRLLPADVLLMGEQHDAPSHQQLQRTVVQLLAEQGMLAAVALEMAEQGTSTAGLPANASEQQVRNPLGQLLQFDFHDFAFSHRRMIRLSVRFTRGIAARAREPAASSLRPAGHRA